MAYYNVMLRGGGFPNACFGVYNDPAIAANQITVIKSCGFGDQANCNKRIRYDGNGGIGAVRNAFNQAIANTGADLQCTVNSNGSCIFTAESKRKNKRSRYKG